MKCAKLSKKGKHSIRTCAYVYVICETRVHALRESQKSTSRIQNPVRICDMQICGGLEKRAHEETS